MSSTEESSFKEADFDKYRKVYESWEHWELRKAFIKLYSDEFPEDEVLCLAQTFINAELLGCKYPSVTMNRIAQLAQNVPEIKKYRESRRNNLKRTFVGAQDASQAKLQKTTAKRILGNEPNDWTKEEKEQINQIPNKPMMQLNERQKSENLRHLLRDVIYFEMSEEDANGSLNKTLACMQKVGYVTMKHDAVEKKFFYIFGGQIIGEGSGDSKKIAKKFADEDLIATLKQNCYTIKNKLQYYSAENVIKPRDQNESSSSSPSIFGKLQEDNLGFRMLKMLGWSGGSLGSKENEGIVDPVNLEIKIGRKGLGAESNEKFDQKYIRNLLKNFKDNEVEYDLVFSEDFTKEERAQIHQIAQTLDLRTKSYGKNNSRHIVISTKLSPQVLRQKLLEGDPYLLEKYEIIPPPQRTKMKWK